ncbi:unnamed protein product [Paramecium octaurelia]|uniref:Uncharacterized protein n=1 Tax=Paramecium octaurelia TaxID=43137 RepID=A0A8S1YMK8_PAROT|nr:unnamed protein product [Paramecium octaurelia]
MPNLLTPYNFPFVSPMHIKTANDQILIENLDFFLGTITSKKLMEYYKRFQVELEIPKLLGEIFSQVLCSFLFQLLSDLNKFKLKNTHLLLQDVLALLRILFQSNQTTVLEEVVQNDQQTLVRILNLILQFMIKQNNINDLESGLCLIFNNNINQSAIIQALTENLIISQIEQKSLPYDLERISKDLKQHYINKFQLNFKIFIKILSFTLLKTKIMENEEQNQYLCLICLKKKFAHYCGRPQNTQFGNLSRHCQKRHSGKTLYLNLKNSQLSSCNHHTSHFTFPPQIKIQQGQLPYIGYYPSIHYKNFILNLKAIDQIIEIILTDKFVHKLFQNLNKVQRTTL